MTGDHTRCDVDLDRVGVTVADAQAMGCSDADLDLLRSEGLLIEDEREPWRPTSLRHVDWIGWMAETAKQEAAAVQAQAARRVKEIKAKEQFFRQRWESDIKEILEQSLERKKDGTYRKKSIDLERVRVSLRARTSRLRVVDDKAALSGIRQAWEKSGRLHAALAPAVIAKVRVTGTKALKLTSEGQATDLGLLKEPLTDWLQGAGRRLNRTTGELTIPDWPGVQWQDPGDDVVFKAAAANGGSGDQ